MDEKFIRNAGEAVDNWTNRELGKAAALFGGKPGEPVPEVDTEDLKSVWELNQHAEKAHPGQQVAIGSDLLKHVCNSNADIQAVSYRAGLLSLLKFVAPDKLAPLMKGSQPDDALFRVAASIPIQWMEVGVVRQGFPFDVEEFFRRLNETQTGETA